MAARPRGRKAGTVEEDVPNAYELQREERIRQNRAKMAALGILEQRSLLEAGFRVVKKTNGPRKEKVKSEPTRSSSRLTGALPEYKGLADDFTECHEGRLQLPKKGISAEEKWVEVVKERRCDNQGRGSLYDSKAGITCHFCRQKKLCGEPDCPRCTERNTDLACIGKSECSRCGSANGRFCRACLLIRYGYELETVRKEMEAGTWLCPHCFEEDHPHEGWICNSSICMTRRGLKPTGIAIYDAQARGFPSVAHFLQARLHKHRESKTSKDDTAPTTKPQARQATPPKLAAEEPSAVANDCLTGEGESPELKAPQAPAAAVLGTSCGRNVTGDGGGVTGGKDTAGNLMLLAIVVEQDDGQAGAGREPEQKPKPTRVRSNKKAPTIKAASAPAPTRTTRTTRSRAAATP